MKIFLDTIGCRLNQAEIEALARQFQAAGNEIVPTAGEADLVVVNTCTVTAKAASDSRAAIRRAKRLGAGSVVVTGCWATLEPEHAAALNGVERVIPNLQKDSLVAEVLNLPEASFDLEPIRRQPLPGAHLRTRAFIKTQDGCDNACTFCITTLARGASRSRRLDRIVADVHSALEGGSQEVVLTGVHLGAWGLDLPSPLRLADLVSGLLEQTNPARLRLSSLEPWDLDEEFFNLWRDPRLCRHLHLPLQSGSRSVLKRMARKTSPEAFSRLVRLAREKIPGLAVTTDLIAGFPGETEAEFNETLAFVQEMQFAGGHVFCYSARPGTPAARMQDQVPAQIARARAASLRTALVDFEAAFQQTFIGKKLPVLWEARATRSATGWMIEGLTDNYLRVSAEAPERRWNRMDEVLIDGVYEDGLFGKLTNTV